MSVIIRGKYIAKKEKDSLRVLAFDKSFEPAVNFVKRPVYDFETAAAHPFDENKHQWKEHDNSKSFEDKHSFCSFLVLGFIKGAENLAKK